MDTRVVRHSLDLFAKHVLPELKRWGNTPPPVMRRAVGSAAGNLLLGSTCEHEHVGITSS
jgi:hypothetical protein